MKLENITVDLSKKIKNIQCVVVSSDYFLRLDKGKRNVKKIKKLKPGQVFLGKDDFFGSEYIIFINLTRVKKQEVIRKALDDCFKRVRRRKIESVGFLADSFRSAGDFVIFSKIAAQEIFRQEKIKDKIRLKKVLLITESNRAEKVLSRNLIGYLDHIKINRGPFLTVDGLIQYKNGIVLIERSNPPLGLALPGGFVDYGEKAEDAAIREVKEETNLDFINVKQFKVYSDRSRDPRFHTVSVVFTGKGRGKLKAASDAKKALVFEIIKGKSRLLKLPPNIVFDHKKIIKDFLNV
ncbi:MAG: NUDIX hydrolase [Candidatus Omnitrophica bacterium]|nr:NUDIX hydrolase [Candidatus Omnitrophota bacterium]MCF7876854.1 NUDIX hydrolase [Candidatus Omnitrophota bacterium]MCF7877887.1 NUDIX hydrolase [Candidatus Omnitrophota bacterium]MCF7892579.1 NUDIX hydrolase [Candidatus Omnitrophota bacterium]